MNYQNVDILLVEDSRADAEMTLRTLKRQGIANHVDWVHDGVEALDYLNVAVDGSIRRPKLVLLDLKMPRMDGMELLRKMKANPQTSSIPVVMMTSSRDEADLIASYGLSVNSFVVKPLKFEDFADTIAQIGMYWIIANKAPE